MTAIEVRRMVAFGEGEALTRKEMWELWRVTEIFHIFSGVLVIQVDIFVRIHWTENLKSVHFLNTSTKKNKKKIELEKVTKHESNNRVAIDCYITSRTSNCERKQSKRIINIGWSGVNPGMLPICECMSWVLGKGWAVD